MRKTVLVEYVKDVETFAGRADEDEKKGTVEAGTRRHVDAASARVLVARGSVKVVDEAKPAPTKAAKPVEGAS